MPRHLPGPFAFAALLTLLAISMPAQAEELFLLDTDYTLDDWWDETWVLDPFINALFGVLEARSAVLNEHVRQTDLPLTAGWSRSKGGVI